MVHLLLNLRDDTRATCAYLRRDGCRFTACFHHIRIYVRTTPGAGRRGTEDIRSRRKAFCVRACHNRSH